MIDMAPRVFIVDDDASVCRSLERLVRSVGLQAETFASAQEFLQRAPHNGPGCLVLDVRMPGLSGLGLQEALAAAHDDMPIIFITAHGDLAMSVRAMKAGAVDFLAKPFNDQDLLDAIHEAITKNLRARHARASTQEIENRLHTLTPREQEVLTLVVSGLLNKQIAAQLGTSEKTIKVHRAHIMQKMQVQSVAQLVHVVEKVDLNPPQNQFSLR
jgi:RNA polymerase sigma factor (sigma-70 family)